MLKFVSFSYVFSFFFNLKKDVNNVIFLNVFFLRKKKFFFRPGKILKPAPLDGKKFVDIRVFLQLAKTYVKTCFKRAFRDPDVTKKNTFWTCFSKNTFKTHFWLGTRELQKKPDIYAFFSSSGAGFRIFSGRKNMFFS